MFWLSCETLPAPKSWCIATCQIAPTRKEIEIDIVFRDLFENKIRSTYIWWTFIKNKLSFIFFRKYFQNFLVNTHCDSDRSKEFLSDIFIVYTKNIYFDKYKIASANS